MKECEIENVLISYAFIKNIDSFKNLFEGWYPKHLTIDSGAFSVWSKGDVIDIDKYINFCLDVKAEVPQTTELNFVNLDVLPGQFGRMPTNDERKQSVEQGWKNMEYMESRGLKVIPVFHQHEDFSWLEKMMKHTDYIGISPANDVSMKQKLAWLNQVFSITRATIKTHGFAVTAYDQLINYPFFSVDSSSWSSGGRFARIPVITKEGKLKSFNYKDIENFDDFWTDLGIKNKADLLTKYQVRNKLGILCFKRFEKWVTELWTKRGIVWQS